MPPTRLALRALALVLAGPVMLAACASGEPEKAQPSAEQSTGGTTIKQGAIRLTAPADEDEVARKSGQGGTTRVQLKKGGMVNVYIVCDGDAPVTVSVDPASRDDDVRATCDKLVEKSAFPTDSTQPLTVQIIAADAVDWQALVTRS